MTDVTQTGEKKSDQSMARQQCHAEKELSSSPQQPRKKETSLSSPARSSHSKVPGPCPPLKLKRQKMNLPTRPLPGQLLPPISPSTEGEDVEVKSENTTMLAATTGSSHQLKSHPPIPKLDPSCLPQNRILLQHMVLDNIMPKQCLKSSGKPSHLAKLEAVSKHQREKTASSSDLSELFLRRDEADLRLSNSSSFTYEGSRKIMSSSGPVRLDKMKLADGVSLLDPPADDKDYLQSNLPGLSTDLNPIQSVAVMPLYSLEQVIAGPPQVTPLFQPPN